MRHSCETKYKNAPTTGTSSADARTDGRWRIGWLPSRKSGRRRAAGPNRRRTLALTDGPADETDGGSSHSEPDVSPSALLIERGARDVQMSFELLCLRYGRLSGGRGCRWRPSDQPKGESRCVALPMALSRRSWRVNIGCEATNRSQPGVQIPVPRRTTCCCQHSAPAPQ